MQPHIIPVAANRLPILYLTTSGPLLRLECHQRPTARLGRVRWKGTNVPSVAPVPLFYELLKAWVMVSRLVHLITARSSKSCCGKTNAVMNLLLNKKYKLDYDHVYLFVKDLSVEVRKSTSS